MTPSEIELELRSYPARASVAKMCAFADCIGELYKHNGRKHPDGSVEYPFRKECMRRIKGGDFETSMKWAVMHTKCSPEQLLAIKTLIFG